MEAGVSGGAISRVWGGDYWGSDDRFLSLEVRKTTLGSSRRLVSIAPMQPVSRGGFQLGDV